MEPEEKEKQFEPETPKTQKFFSGTQKTLNKLGRFFVEFLKTAIIIGILAFIIRFFLVQPFIVEGASMEPSFQDNEYLLIEKVSNYFSGVKRGEVVVFRYPENPDINYIKRVIGLPGDKIEIENGKIRIWPEDSKDSIILREDYLAPNTFTSGDIEVTLGEDEYFVMGDNRGNSSDSRDWGALSEKNIIGHSWLVIFPTSKFGIVPQAEYEI